jgi:hypothetical protein
MPPVIPPTPANSAYIGPQDPTSGSDEFNAHAFLVEQLLNRVSTATLVKIISCTNAGADSPVGLVNVQPLVNQLDGSGNATPHTTIYNLAYFRLQGGTNAVIIDPQVGDIGIAVFADRDISSVKSNKAQSNPGSYRRFNMADGLYIGGVLNGTPVCYIQFVDGGISMTPDQGVTSLTIIPGLIRMVADEINTHANNKNTWDAGGVGFVYQGGANPEKIDTYTDGVSTDHHAPTPPEVPT